MTEVTVSRTLGMSATVGGGGYPRQWGGMSGTVGEMSATVGGNVPASGGMSATVGN